MTGATDPRGTTVRGGAAVVEVAVEPGTPLSGYAAREGGATGVHDPCTARAVAVENTCWVALDVCGVDRDTTDAVAARVGLPPGHLQVTATHTHSGPACTPGRLAGDDPVTRARLVGAAVTAATRALAARRPVRLEWSSVRGAGVAVDRRTPARRVDPPVDLLRLVRTDAAGGDTGTVGGGGEVVAWLVSHPCHPVVLAADNRLVSADHVWALREELESQAPGSVAVFLPGTCGDLNNGHAAEASYTSAPLAGRTFAEAERIGRHLARTALAAPACALGADPAGQIEVRSTTVELALAPLDDEPPAALARRWAAERPHAEPGRAALLDAWLAWASGRSDADPTAYCATVTAIRWAGLWLLGVPGEPFLSFADGVRRRVDGPVVVTGYTGDCPGYLPDADAYPAGGYEVADAHRYYGMPAPFARGSAERLLEAAVGLVDGAAAGR